jgi:hypothetical protein
MLNFTTAEWDASSAASITANSTAASVNAYVTVLP